MQIIRFLFLIVLLSFAQAEEVVRLGNLLLAQYGAAAYLKEPEAQCGIQVKEHIFDKAYNMMPAIIAGEIDVALLPFQTAILLRAQGVPIYVVSSFSKGGIRVLSHPKANVLHPTDLKGKRVGTPVNTMQELMLFLELAKHKLSWSTKPGKDVLIVSYPNFSELNIALEKHEVDVISQSEPQASQALNKGFGIEIFRPYDTELGEPYRTVVMTEALYRNRPVAEKFIHCFIRVSELFIDNPRLAERYVREKMFNNKITKQDFTDALDNSPFTYDLTVDFMQKATDAMVKLNMIKPDKPIQADTWVKLDILNQVKHSLGIARNN